MLSRQEAAGVLADAAHASFVIIDDADALDGAYRRALRNHPERADEIEAAYTHLCLAGVSEVTQ